MHIAQLYTVQKGIGFATPTEPVSTPKVDVKEKQSVIQEDVGYMSKKTVSPD